MATLNKVNAFVLNLGNKKHNLGSDQFKVALSAAAPTATMIAVSEITEISYTNCSTRNITTTSFAQASGVATLILTDLVLTATGTVGPFRYVTVYNSTATSFELIGWYDYGASITLANGDTFTIDFDGSNGFFTLT